MQFAIIIACLWSAQFPCAKANTDTDDDGTRISLYQCQNGTFFIETLPAVQHLAEYLDEVITESSLQQFEETLHQENACSEIPETRNVTTDILSFVENWMKELVNNSRSIFLYAPSLDEYNLFELEDTAASNDDDDMDKMNLTIQDNIFKQAWNEDYVNNDLGNDEQEDKIFEAESDNDYYNYQGPSIKGCVIRLKNKDQNGFIAFNFTNLSDAKKVLGRSSLEQDYCRKYVHLIQSMNKTCSPFYGLPIIYVPGIISSQLIAHKKNRSNNNSWESKLLWLDLTEALINSGNLADYLRLTIKEDGTSSSHEALNIDVGNWGHPDSVGYFETPRFAWLTRFLESMGYQAGINIRAAPYDFRKAPDESEVFMEKFKRLIEATFLENYNKKVVIFGHSMGNLFTLYFLNRQSQEWKDTFIHSFVSLAAPWYGSTDAVKFFLRGQLDYFLLRPIESYLKSIAETWKSLLFLLPNDDLYNATFPIIRTPSKNYTVMDYEELFRDTNHENMIPAYHRVKNLTKAMAAPGVEVHCMFSYYGSHGNTDYYYEFLSNTSFPNGAMKIVYEDGDGTINLESARACLQWKFQQAQPVHEKAFYLVEHSALLYDKNLFKYMQELLFKQA